MPMRCARLRRRRAAPSYPVIAGVGFRVAKLYRMLPVSVSGDPGARTPAGNQTVRNVFATGPDKKVKLVLDYPMTTGRNLDKVPLVIDSLPVNLRMRDAVHRTDIPDQKAAGQHRIGSRIC